MSQVNTNIQGNLPFSSAGSGVITAGGGGTAFGNAVGDQYSQAYNSALAQNQANYQNILSGYQQTAANQQTQQQAVAGGYTGLANQISQGYGQLGQNLGQGYGALGQQQSAGYGGLGQQLGQGYGALGQQLGAGYNALSGGVQGQLGAGLQTLQQGGNALQQGYGALQGGVLGTIQGIGASQAQAIQDAYKQQQGGTTQQLLNSGLGNSTVVGNMQRGVELDRSKAQTALANQMAQLTAGYQSQLGLAGLNQQNQSMLAQSGQQNLMAQYGANLGQQGLQAQQQTGMADLGAQQGVGQAGLAALGQTGLAGLGAAQQTGMAGLGAQQGIGQAGLGYQGLAAAQGTAQANQQLGFMNSVSAQYPDAAQYGNLLSQYGQTQQANADRNQNADQFKQLLDLAKQQRAMQAAGRGGANGGVLGTESGAGLPGQGQLSNTGQPGGAGRASGYPSQAELALRQLQAQQYNPQDSQQNFGGAAQYGNLLGGQDYTQGGAYGNAAAAAAGMGYGGLAGGIGAAGASLAGNIQQLLMQQYAPGSNALQDYLDQSGYDMNMGD